MVLRFWRWKQKFLIFWLPSLETISSYPFAVMLIMSNPSWCWAANNGSIFILCLFSSVNWDFLKSYSEFENNIFWNTVFSLLRLDVIYDQMKQYLSLQYQNTNLWLFGCPCNHSWTDCNVCYVIALYFLKDSLGPLVYCANLDAFWIMLYEDTSIKISDSLWLTHLAHRLHLILMRTLISLYRFTILKKPNKPATDLNTILSNRQ